MKPCARIAVECNLILYNGGRDCHSWSIVIALTENVRVAIRRLPKLPIYMHPRQKVINTDNRTSALHADKFVRCIGTYEFPTAYAGRLSMDRHQTLGCSPRPLPFRTVRTHSCSEQMTEARHQLCTSGNAAYIACQHYSQHRVLLVSIQ